MQIEGSKKPHVAVASSNGIEVDLHIGQARQLLIYGPGEDGLLCLLGARSTPEPGGGEARWKALADVLGDCFALLASGAGPKPMKILADQNIDVFIAEGNMKKPLDILFGGENTKNN